MSEAQLKHDPSGPLMGSPLDRRYFVTDPDRSRWFYMSPSMIEFWGLQCSKLEESLVTSVDRGAVDDYYRSAYLLRREQEQSGGSCDYTYRIRHPRLGVRWTRTQTRGLRLAGGNVRVFGVSEDVTDLRIASGATGQDQHLPLSSVGGAQADPWLSPMQIAYLSIKSSEWARDRADMTRSAASNIRVRMDAVNDDRQKLFAEIQSIRRDLNRLACNVTEVVSHP